MNRPSARLRFGLAVLAILLAAAGARWWMAPHQDGRTPLRLDWAAAQRDPGAMLAFLAERAQDAQGVPDWRRLTGPGGDLWATLRFELAGPPPGSTAPGDVPPPDLARTAEAYDAIGVAAAAGLVRAIPSGDSSVPREIRIRFTAMRAEIAAARAAYAERHRGEIDPPR